MTTSLITGNYVTNRKYGGALGNVWYSQPLFLEIPHLQGLFNVFPNQVQASALASFTEELKANLNKDVRLNPDDLVISFSKMLNTLLEVNATSIHTQITMVNSFVIKANTSNGNIYVEMFFDEITGWLNETVVNIFHNQQLQFNNSGSLDAMILAIKQYFGNEEMDYLSVLKPATVYELSGANFTATEF